MSLASSDTVIATPAKVACLYLAKFDVKEGYTLVWSSSPSTIDLAGIEYKALPSGVHDYEATNIYLTHESRGTLYYGLARFRQLNLNEGNAADRSKVKMYSLGVLLEPLAGDHWKPHEFATVGFEHVDALDAALAAYLRDENEATLTKCLESLTKVDLDVPKLAPPKLNHPLHKLPAVLALVGPLVFPIYKAALLRKRIMIFNHNQGTLGDPTTCGALAYILALLSVVPRDVRFEQNSEPLSYSQPLYSVGLQDLNTDILAHHPGYIASTSDEIIKFQANLYDLGVDMPAAEHGVCLVFRSSNVKSPVRATFNDYAKFLKLFRRLPQLQPAVADDLASIRTSSSIFSGLHFMDKECGLESEPVWWFQDATSPMSWREYIWLAFSWFASAGTTSRKATTHLASDADDDEQQDTLKQQLAQLAAVVGQFHRLSKKWFYFVDEIVAEALEDTEHGPVTVELTYQDIVDMELDPYLSEDLDFVREFVLFYWDTVDTVEIGLGVHGFCC